MKDYIQSRRSSQVVYFSPILDELTLSPEAIRVYIHLLCWTSRKSEIYFPSIEEISSCCFPRLTAKKAEKTIEKAIAELIDRNIVCRESTISSDGVIQKNFYWLTDDSTWKHPERSAV